MSVTTVQDPALVKRFNEIVHAKLAEAEQLPDAVAHYKWGQDPVVMLDDGELSVKVYYDLSDKAWRMQFGEMTTPACDVYMEDGELKMHCADDDRRPELSDLLERAAAADIWLSELIPYGWAEDGKIILVCSGERQSIEKMDGMTVYFRGFMCYVLEGQQMPAEFKAVWDGFAPSQIWELIRQGKLVRLSTRIRNLPGELWSKFDGSNAGWLEFEASDGRSPKFVTDGRYISWHPVEEYPGQKFGADRMIAEIGTANPLREWFR